MSTEFSRIDEGHLRRCLDLATQALEAGDDPFGSVLVDADGAALAEAMNRENTDGDPTAHPELALVNWAIAHLTPEQRLDELAAILATGVRRMLRCVYAPPQPHRRYRTRFLQNPAGLALRCRRCRGFPAPTWLTPSPTQARGCRTTRPRYRLAGC